MTYRRNGTEYLNTAEMQVYEQGRTANNSQVYAALRYSMSRAKVSRLTRDLELRGFIRDTGKGAAYHWRPAGKPVIQEEARS